MKYMYAYFKGYAGFYNGMGLETIEIDFSKSVNKVILIIGKNGSGKTTLLQHLNPFPDPSTSFVREMDAEKRLSLFDNGDSYNIQIISQADNKGGRKTTKAFIQKNGEELNSNGNVSSYKEIIFSEFELDSNYVSLSMLSSNDRGLGDKTPADRKRFASNIIENLESYNNIYKTLNKKSLIFKSHINTLGDKIRNLGNRVTIDSELSALGTREKEVTEQLNELRETVGALKAKSTIDPNDAALINQLQIDKVGLESDLESQQVELKKWKTSLKIKEKDIDTVLSEDRSLLEKYSIDESSLSTSLTEKSNQTVSLYSSLRELKATVENQDEIDMNLESNVKLSDDKISGIISDLNTKGVQDINFDIIPLIDSHIEACEEIVRYVESLFDSLENDSDINYICSDKNWEQEAIHNVTEKMAELESVQKSIEKLEKDAEILKALSIKPKTCTNRTCPFISEAISLKSQYKGSDISVKLSKMLEMEKSIKDEIPKLEAVTVKMVEFDKLRSMLKVFIQSTFSKLYLPLFNIIGIEMTPEILIQEIGNKQSLNEFRDVSIFYDIKNLLSELKVEKEVNEKLHHQFEIQGEKIKVIEANKKQIKDIEDSITKLETETTDINTNLNNIKGLISSLNEKITKEESYKQTYDNVCTIQNNINSIDVRLNEFSGKTEDARLMLETLEKYNPMITDLEEKLRLIREGISERQGIITMIDSYTNEYNQYQEKFQMIETIKKYCSPSGGGIQTIFMQLYMSKTLELSNQLLGMMFGGELQLMEFVINEKEFRIPFIGSGLPVDDISSGSASQVAIMGMIINLVLLHQGSTKFNIARLDESDASLDSRNRAYFMNIIRSAADILEMEQIIMISHSMEEDMSNTDVIKLKGYDDYELQSGGNIIYDYNKGGS